MKRKYTLPLAAALAFVLLAGAVGIGQARPAMGPAPLPGWTMEMADSTVGSGDCSVTQLDSSGNPHVVYFHAGLKTLFYTMRSGTAWMKPVEVDPARRGVVQCYSGMVLQSTGKPAVVYTTDDARVFYAPMTCTPSCAFHPQQITINLPWTVVQYPAIAMAQGNSPRIAFVTDTHLTVVFPSGAGWTFEQPKKADKVSYVLVGTPPLNLLIGPDGSLHLGYICKLHHPWHLQRTASGWLDPERLDPGDDYNGIALALDSTGAPREAAIMGPTQKLTLYTYQCAGGSCAWGQQVLDELPDTNINSEISGVRLALDSQNRTRLSYYYRDASGKAGLVYLVYDGYSWVKKFIDPRVDAGRRSSLVLNQAGQANISYFEGGGGGLDFAVQTAQAVQQGIRIYLPFFSR